MKCGHPVVRVATWDREHCSRPSCFLLWAIVGVLDVLEAALFMLLVVALLRSIL